MTNFNKQNLKDLQKLSRIKLTEIEEQNLLNNMQKILDYVELLSEVDTKNIPCCNHVSQVQTKNVLREDEVGELLDRDQFLKNSPDQIGGMIRVPPIIKS